MRKKDTQIVLFMQMGVGHKAARLGLFRPGSILNKLSSLKYTNVGVFISFYCLKRSFAWQFQYKEVQSRGKYSVDLFTRQYPPPKYLSCSQIFQSSSAVSDLETKRSYSIFLFLQEMIHHSCPIVFSARTEIHYGCIWAFLVHILFKRTSIY